MDQESLSSNQNIITSSALANYRKYANTGNLAMSSLTPNILLGPSNTQVTCPFCAASVQTAVQYTTTSRTHRTAALCTLLCCCCWMYCCDSAKNTDHYCPSCNRYLGTYEK